MSTPCRCHTSLKDFKHLRYVLDVRTKELSLRYKSKDERKDNYEIKRVMLTPREKDHITEGLLMNKFNLTIKEVECPVHRLCHLISLVEEDDGLTIDHIHRDINKIYIEYELLSED